MIEKSISRDGALLANTAWEALFTAQSQLIREFGRSEMWKALAMREYDVLYTLRKGPKTGLRLRELNEGVLLSQPSLSRMVDRLIERGLVAREAAPEDGRGVLISLTAAGLQLQKQVGREHAKGVTETMRSSLSDDELRELTALCEKLAASSPQNH